jgi:hypothetical protein
MLVLAALSRLASSHCGGKGHMWRNEVSVSLMLHLLRRRQVPRENQATLRAIKFALEKEVFVA